MNITELTVHELKEKLEKKELTSYEITKAYTDRIAEKEKDVQAFVTTLEEEALEKSKEIDKKIESGEAKSELAGIPIGIKDKYPNKNIWCYTGFDFEKDIMPECKTSAVTKQLISNIDVIVDGKFDENKMDRKLKFRGSSNQRIIDVKETLHDNAIKMVKFTD